MFINHSSNPVVFIGGRLCPLGDTEQCLDIFGYHNLGWGACDWYLNRNAATMHLRQYTAQLTQELPGPKRQQCQSWKLWSSPVLSLQKWRNRDSLSTEPWSEVSRRETRAGFTAFTASRGPLAHSGSRKFPTGPRGMGKAWTVGYRWLPGYTASAIFSNQHSSFWVQSQKAEELWSEVKGRGEFGGHFSWSSAVSVVL